MCDAAPNDTFVCNCCVQYIKLTRYKCTTCSDYDLCEVCIKFACVEGHDENHHFFKTEIGAVASEASFDSDFNAEEDLEDIDYLEMRLKILDCITYFGFDTIAISSLAGCTLAEVDAHIKMFVILKEKH